MYSDSTKVRSLTSYFFRSENLSKKQLEQLSQKLLCNPLIQDYQVVANKDIVNFNTIFVNPTSENKNPPTLKATKENNAYYQTIDLEKRERYFVKDFSKKITFSQLRRDVGNQKNIIKIPLYKKSDNN